MKHHLKTNPNDALHNALSPAERLCRRIADWTGAPAALVAAIVFQIAWIVVGTLTRMDPFPFVFLLTCSNVVQLVLIFVIAVAQRQQSLHDEIRAETDHTAISALLLHQDLQNVALLRLLRANGVEAADIENLSRKFAIPTDEAGGEQEMRER